MSTTITIPADLEKKIAGRAAAEGKNVEVFALEALERAAENPSLRDLFADVHEQLEKNGVSDEEVDTLIETNIEEFRKQRRA